MDALLVLVAAMVGGSPSNGAPENYAVGEPIKEPIEEEWIGRCVADIALSGREGKSVLLSDYWDNKPVFLTLVFTRCAGICSPYLGLLQSTVEKVGGAGQDFDMIVVSFDPRDAADDMASLASHYDLEDRDGWVFAVPSSAESIDRLCESIGYTYTWDESRQQFDHAAVTEAIRNGEIARLSLGESISPARFKEMLSEANGDFVSVYPQANSGNTLFRCFDYDPEIGFTPQWGLLLILAPSALVFAATVMLFGLRRRGTGGHEQK